MPEVPPVIRIVLPVIFMRVLLLRYGGPVSARNLDRRSVRAGAGEEGLSMDRRSLPREANAARRAGSCRSRTAGRGPGRSVVHAADCKEAPAGAPLLTLDQALDAAEHPVTRLCSVGGPCSTFRTSWLSTSRGSSTPDRALLQRLRHRPHPLLRPP
ncbi:DUF6233 domain-containing protein [Streptomyces mirabilis]|uniref:DUF6233 domain-containing protein n=1 Tax=Streptomyces mirabilis TaxID=68239 RepID=UPI003F4D5FBC